jgi:curved DNA-binding protein CbpA
VTSAAEISEVSDELRNKIKEKFHQVKDTDLWGVLEVEKDADLEAIKKAYYVMAKVYHPDRIRNVKDEDLQHQVSFVAARLNEAFQILTDPEALAEYQAQNGTGVRTQADRKEDARIHFQKSLVFLKRKDYTKAAESIRWAADMDPMNGDYQAYRIWIDYLRSKEGTERERATNAKNDMLRVAKENRESFFCAKFLYLLYKKIGDQENYTRTLGIAYKLNPRDVETAREVRLHNLRKEKEDKRGRIFGIKIKK